jgi:hypothetical protein
MEIGREHRLLLAPLGLVLLAQTNDGSKRLHVEPVAFGLGLDLTQVYGKRCLLLFEALDTGNDGTKLVFG